ncbi:MAG TPA: DUF5000 domain-containing lipoprotein [Chitinophagaceae bacterium]|nr:DUF5000 domain-containing lipoprotein [Chitinophagaceae bacterium]
MKKLLCFIAVLISVACWYGCKKETNAYIDAKAPAPMQVSGLKVVNTPGGAIITYKIPQDPNLSYVKAEYEIQPGVFREAKSSYYTDTLAIVGYGDTQVHEVKIYSVGKNAKQSTPVSINVQPLTPPVNSVFTTLTLTTTFGGVFITFQDSTQADLAITVIMDSTGLGTWAPVTTYYTAQLAGSFAARGLDTIRKKFGVYIRDHWNNISDTLFETLSPLYEQLIPKNLFKVYPLLNDSWKSLNGNYKIQNLWNDIVNGHEDIFATADYNKLPQWFTIDLGENVVLSRMKLFQRLPYPFNAVWVKEFEIWGSNQPDPDGSWDSWQLLGGPFPFRKPSGKPGFDYTADDLDYVAQGEDFIFPAGIPAVRYLRFKLLDTYGGVGKYQFGELTFWGQIVP